MKKLDNKFVREVLDDFKKSYQIEPKEEVSSDDLFKIAIAKISADVFAISFNALIQEGYLQSPNEGADTEQR